MATGVFGLNKIYKKQTDNIEERNFSQWPESPVYGYYAGGFNGTTLSTVARLDFSSETFNSPGKNLGIAKYSHYSLSSGFHGYFVSGINNPPVTYRGEVERLDYSSEVVSYPGKNQAGYYEGASISGIDYGYMVAGNRNAPPVVVDSVIKRLDFYSETIQQPANRFTYSGEGMTAALDPYTYGYVFGGVSTSNISRLDFSSETFTLRSSKLPGISNWGTGTSSATYGYIVGGNNPTIPGYISTITRLDFSTEVVSNPGNNLPSIRGYSSETSNFHYGYFGGGTGTPATVNTITRLDFSTDIISSPGNNLPYTAYAIRGVSGGASILPS